MRSDGELILGTIVVSAPEYGLAIVCTSGGTRVVKEKLLAFLPYSDARCGALLQQHIQDGSTVICMRSIQYPYMAYILTAVNDVGSDMTDTMAGRVFYNTNGFTTADTNVFDSVIDAMKNSFGSRFKNHSNSTDMDVLPGDVDVVNNGGPAGIHVGKYLVQLKGSPLAFIDVAALSDQIRLVASKVSTHTPTTFQQTSDEVSVDDMAVDAAEAFGLESGFGVLKQEQQVENKTVPLFRMQHVRGPAVDGEEHTISNFPVDEQLHTDRTEPNVLSRTRESLSGELCDASTLCYSSVKSPAIVSILQYGYFLVNKDKDEKAAKILELLSQYQYEEPEEEEKEVPKHTLNQEIMDAAINGIVDKLLSGDYIETLKQRLASAGLYVAENPLSLQFDKHTETGPTTKPYYDLPKYLQLTDPVTGKIHTYYDSTSFITQQPDGSILLCDGYGSEIRMSQGNIIISPALDLILRPGRDMSAMVSRHLSLNAQEYITVNSTRSVYIRATGSMQLAAATSVDKDGKPNGKGKLTIECNDTTNSDKTGIIIKSLGNASFTGHNLYIGINKGNSEAKGRVEKTDNPGTVILDAGEGGAIIERSARHLSDTQMFTVVTSGEVNTAFTVGGNIIGLYAQQVIAPVDLNMSVLDGAQKVTVVRNGELRVLTISTSSTPDLIIKGNIAASGHVKVGGNMLVLQTVVSRGSYYVNGGQIIDKKETFEPMDMPSTKTNANLENSTGSSALYSLRTTLYQDAYVGGNSFLFPTYYGFGKDIVIPGMVWQEATRAIVKDVSTVAWKEVPVISLDGKKTTACYPGWNAWESGHITKSGYEQDDLQTGYITNTEKD